MSNPIRSLLQAGAETAQSLLAQDCFLCQAASGNAPLCPACDAALPYCGECCPGCALPSRGGAECGDCLARRPHFDATCAAFSYAYPVDALIQALKYRGQLALAGLFAHKLLARLGGTSGVDVIVPLPLHPARLAERGFNQSVEIARALARLVATPMDAQLARRVRDTRPQADLPWKERTANIRDAFSCPSNLKGMRVAVVDDVMTTGATLNEFAATLKSAGADRVENWVVARTPRV